MKVRLNGDEREVREGTRLGPWLAELGLSGKPVAIEVNRELVPRVRHAETELRDGDIVEVVTLVGGG